MTHDDWIRDGLGLLDLVCKLQEGRECWERHPPVEVLRAMAFLHDYQWYEGDDDAEA
jgi:hypothetical protein